MCDQDHFDDDLKEFDARGNVTRRQFGVLLGAGVMMMLPKVVNAVAVTDSDVTIKTPDGTCDAYFVHPSTGTAPGVLVWPDIFVLRRRTRDQHAEQSAPAGREDEGAAAHRYRGQRRHAGAGREERAEGDVRESEPPRGNRGVHGRRARLVPAGLGCLQRGAGRESMEPSPGAVRKGAGLTFGRRSRMPTGAEASVGRRGVLRRLGRIGAGLGAGPGPARGLQGNGDAAEAAQDRAVRGGRAQHLTILHTADIHAQLDIHDEFFWEAGKPVFRRRGGVATLRSMIDALRRQNPGNTLVVDGGDCFQGSAVASFSKGRVMVPLVNAIAYDLVLPGNWEVVYGKEAMIENLNGYSAAKVCANMFHDGDARNGASAAPIFPPYQTFSLGGVKVGFVGYNDPLTPTRQSPAYSRGIRFTHPREDLAGHVRTLL